MALETLQPQVRSTYAWRHTTWPSDPPTSREVYARLADCLKFEDKAPGCTSSSERRAEAGKRAGTCAAYRQCEEIIKHHSKSFYLSARLLPAEKRRAIMALYAFCRTSDDIVDSADDCADRMEARTRAQGRLEQWEAMNRRSSMQHENPVVQAWCDTRRAYNIPSELAADLISGVRMDLTIQQYETWSDLWLYSYRVASTVGLMSMYITGIRTIDAVPYAVQLGVALQLTNILRDVGEDLDAGRVYLPLEDLARFGYTADMLHERLVNANFARLMQFEINRARALYSAAWPGIAMLSPDSRMAVAAAATIYRGILDKIEQANYDVFRQRAHLSMGDKLRTLPLVWLRSRTRRELQPGLTRYGRS